MGDANICAVEWLEEDYKNKELSSLIQEFMADTASSQLVKEFTRSEVIRGGAVSRSCIDHCYSNSPDKISKPEVVAVGNSDHLGVVITKYTKVAKSKPNTVMKRSYKHFDVEKFLTEIVNSDININVTASDELDTAAEIFQNQFRIILDKHAPIKIYQMRRNYSPYLKKETKLLMEEHKILKEEMTKHGDTDLAKEIKALSKEIVKAVKADEKDYYETGLGDKVDVYTAWRTANELLGSHKNLAPTAIKEIGMNGEVEIVRNPQKLATMFNKFFRRKVQRLRTKTESKLPTISPTKRLRTWLQKREQPIPSFNFKEIDKTTFRKIMKKMKSSRVHGVDWIDGYSLKSAGPLIEDSLMHLVNLSIRQNRFAACWKPQLIHPFHKKKSKNDIENYRPVSHLVQVGKIAEYAAQFQIIEHFEKNNLFHQNHHGSLAHHSTATAVIQLYDSWLDASEKHQLSAVCLFDQSAAYDLLCHKIFGEKLRIYNFSESAIAWVLSYLGGRTQIVQVESKTSAPLDCEDHGVPQGSVLGGLFHLINSNDFPDCHEEGEGVVYVDDDSDSVHNADPVRLRDIIEQEARNSSNWLEDNRLCVAGEKSKLMVIGTKQLRTQKINNEMRIEVDGKEVVDSASEKLLGIVINNELTWRNHLYGDEENEGLVTQLAKRIGILQKLSRRMSRKRLKLFASGIFYSKLSYCLPVFGNVFGLEQYKEENNRYTSYTMADNHNLQVLQNKLNRLLTGSPYNTPTIELLEQTGSMSIQQMIAFQTIIMSFKVIKFRKPGYLSKNFQERKTQQNIRGISSGLIQPKLSLSISKEGFVNRGITLMNKLDDSLRSEQNLENFKTGLQKWVKNNISAKPKNRFQTIPRRAVIQAPPAPVQAAPSRNLITRYFQPQNR